jgi:antitoxin component YwqK of YwqJK toxin-antitoxin module
MPFRKQKIVDGVTIKYHSDGETVWSEGRYVDGVAHGYWVWFRPDGTIKRSGYFNMGTPSGRWTTYDAHGVVIEMTDMGRIGLLH